MSHTFTLAISVLTDSAQECSGALNFYAKLSTYYRPLIAKSSNYDVLNSNYDVSNYDVWKFFFSKNHTNYILFDSVSISDSEYHIFFHYKLKMPWFIAT